MKKTDETRRAARRVQRLLLEGWTPVARWRPCVCSLEEGGNVVRILVEGRPDVVVDLGALPPGAVGAVAALVDELRLQSAFARSAAVLARDDITASRRRAAKHAAGGAATRRKYDAGLDDRLRALLDRGERPDARALADAFGVHARTVRRRLARLRRERD